MDDAPPGAVVEPEVLDAAGAVELGGQARGRYRVPGGRVLGVTGLGPVVAVAIDNAYKGVREIAFEGAHFRRDIGARALETGN